MPTWESEAADKLWAEATSMDRWKAGDTESFEDKIQGLADERIWEMRNVSRAALVNYVKENSRSVFSPDVLTIGFARRFVPYKRPDLLLMDEDRLVRLLTNHQQPVQLVIAGKAPPADQGVGILSNDGSSLLTGRSCGSMWSFSPTMIC